MNSLAQQVTMQQCMRAETLTCEDYPGSLRRRQLNAPRLMTGKERRMMNPNRGLIKLFERHMDIAISRYVYPLFGHIWSPYSWLLERRFTLAETKLAPMGWPAGLAPLRVLLLTDIHAGIFLKPETLWQIVLTLMRTKPDLVVIGGDLVTGHTDEAIPILEGLCAADPCATRRLVLFWQPRLFRR